MNEYKINIEICSKNKKWRTKYAVIEMETGVAMTCVFLCTLYGYNLRVCNF